MGVIIDCGSHDGAYGCVVQRRAQPHGVASQDVVRKRALLRGLDAGIGQRAHTGIDTIGADIVLGDARAQCRGNRNPLLRIGRQHEFLPPFRNSENALPIQGGLQRHDRRGIIHAAPRMS
jgi:hypothetical protein